MKLLEIFIVEFNVTVQVLMRYSTLIRHKN